MRDHNGLTILNPESQIPIRCLLSIETDSRENRYRKYGTPHDGVVHTFRVSVKDVMGRDFALLVGHRRQLVLGCGTIADGVDIGSETLLRILVDDDTLR